MRWRPWSSGLAACLTCGALNAADPRPAQVLIGEARWESLGDAPCPWLPQGARPIEMLLGGGSAADALSLLVLDRQHVFALRANDTGGYVATSIESIAQLAPGRLRLPSDGTEGSAELSFTRAGDACAVLLALPADARRVDGAAEIAAAHERLQVIASVARQINESNRFLRQKNDAKGALPSARNAYDTARQKLGKGEPMTAVAAEQLASVHWNLGEYAQALALAADATATLSGHYGPDAAYTLNLRKNVALYRWELGDFAGARAEFELVRPLILARFGERSNAALAVTNNLAALYGELGLLHESLDMSSFVYLARESRTVRAIAAPSLH
jgi:hypothetical protein